MLYFCAIPWTFKEQNNTQITILTHGQFQNDLLKILFSFLSQCTNINHFGNRLLAFASRPSLTSLVTFLTTELSGALLLLTSVCSPLPSPQWHQMPASSEIRPETLPWDTWCFFPYNDQKSQASLIVHMKFWCFRVTLHTDVSHKVFPVK